MTILDSSNLLFRWFADHSTFNFEDHFKKVVLVTEDPAGDQAAILIGLREYEKDGLLSSAQVGAKDVWVLTRPFDQYRQSVSITPEIAGLIAGFINQYVDETGEESQRCDPRKIGEKDVGTLLFLLDYLANEACEQCQDGAGPESDDGSQT